MRTRTLSLIAFAAAFSLVSGAVQRSYAQATTPLYDPPPTSPGFQLPHVGGSLHYSFTASESIRTGAAGGNTLYQTYFSGDAGYISRSTLNPFSMIYSGGASVGNNPGGSRIFQNIAVSQTLTRQRWTFLATDTLNYLPDTPVAGLSGVAGLGDVGSAPVQTGSSSTSGLQSNLSTRLTNSVAASADRVLTGRTSLNVSGMYVILRFPGSVAGLQYDRESGTVGATHILSARTQVGGSYFYSYTTYNRANVTSTAQGANLNLTHQWSARTTTDFSGGPVYIKTTGANGRYNVSFNASLAYVRGLNHYTLSADRRTNTGSGVTIANQATNVAGSMSRTLGRFSSASASIFYIHSAILPSSITTPYVISSVNASVQISRALSRTLSAYASYTARHQDVPSSGLAVNALQGTQNIAGFGLTYTPRPISLGR